MSNRGGGFNDFTFTGHFDNTVPYSNDEGYVRHFEQVARQSTLPLVLRGNLSNSLMDRLVHIDSIVAMKQDVSRSYFVEKLIHCSPRIGSYSGGSFEWFIAGQPYGAMASVDTYATFAPEISARFWRAMRRHDMPMEAEIVEKYDHPLISDNFSNPFWHATLEHFGVAKRHLCPPQHSYTEKEMATVNAFFDKLGVLPHECCGGGPALTGWKTDKYGPIRPQR